ncbi:MAG: PhoH family protein [Planctomycetes bacterium]|nr:PhoH family protein [Planctomycetota bacterium]
MEKNLKLRSNEHRHLVFGPRDRHLRLIRDAFGVRLAARETDIHILGAAESVHEAQVVLEELERMAEDGQVVSEREVRQIIDAVTRSGQTPSLQTIEVFVSGRPVRPQTPGQQAYCNAIEKNDLVFCIGPAGSGKTYLAVAMTVQALKRQQIKRIVLVRPAVEAGEKLGFLPGDILAKVHPYLRPLLDALHDMMGFEQVRAYMESDIIEIIPLAYMRGRTLNDAYIILDEAQNTTPGQMKMFLTRMGMRSKMVVTGDITQVDLQAGTKSGMVDAWEKLSDIAGIEFHEMTRADIVRHRLVQDIVNAYEKHGGGDEHPRPHAAAANRRPPEPDKA